MVEAALARARHLGIAVSAAVTDPGGHVVAIARSDGAAWITAEIAAAAAYTATALRRPTIENVKASESHPLFWHSVLQRDSKLIMARSGVLLVEDGILVGALGVSGGTGEQDLECADAGVQVLRSV